MNYKTNELQNYITMDYKNTRLMKCNIYPTTEKTKTPRPGKALQRRVAWPDPTVSGVQNRSLHGLITSWFVGTKVICIG